MASHILHKPIHTGGLVDGCARCDEIALLPFTMLDEENLADLVARTKAWLADDETAVARSRNEHRAMLRVEARLQAEAA